MAMQDELQQAERNLIAAKNEVSRVKKKVEDRILKFMKAMPVGRNVPCAVAVLPSGEVAVHVWVESSSNPNQLHIVTPGYYTDDAQPRKKFSGEQLGDGSCS